MNSTNELGASHSCVSGCGLFWFCMFCFCCVFGCVLCVFAVCLVYDDDGPVDYVQVLPSSLLRLSTVDGLEH